MHLFFTCSYYGKAQYQKYYDLIVKSIKNTGVALSSPEIDDSFPPPGVTPHHQLIRQSIQVADAVIFEVSHSGFELGYEAALAIQNKKHVLVLSLHQDYSHKIDHRYFHGAKYSKLNLDDIITDFINGLRHHQYDQRFNFFLSQKQLETLDQNSRKLGLTRSDYLRSLLDSTKKT